MAKAMKTLFLVLGFHIIVQYAEGKGMYVLPLSEKNRYILILNMFDNKRSNSDSSGAN